jgi:hypothetical protein
MPEKERRRIDMKKIHLKLAMILLTVAFCAFLSAAPACAESSVTFSWDKSEGATGYNLYYGPGSRNYSKKGDMGNVLTYTLTALQTEHGTSLRQLTIRPEMSLIIPTRSRPRLTRPHRQHLRTLRSRLRLMSI